MLIEKEVLVEAKIDGYRSWATLVSYSRGNSTIYLENNALSTRDELNNTYKLFKNGEDFKVKTTVKTKKKSDVIKRFAQAIDQYTDYIDDYKQQRKAEKRNCEFKKIIKELEAMA